MFLRRHQASTSEWFTSSGTRAARRTRGRAGRRLPTAPLGRTWSRSVLPRAPCSGTSGTSQAASSSRAARIATSAFGTRTSSRIHRRPSAAILAHGRAWRTPSCPSSTATRRAQRRTTASRATRTGSATASITLRSDDRWRHAMTPWNRRLVSALTSPLLLRYGYPLRPAVVHATGTRPSSTERRPARAPRHALLAACAATFAGVAPRDSRVLSRRMSSTR